MMRAVRQFGAAALLCAGLGGCVVAAPPAAPLMVVPGPSKTMAAFQQDDAACKAAPAPQPAPAGQPAPPQPPGAVYLNCMAARGNAMAQLPPPPPVYVYADPFPDYDPWLWGPGFAGFGVYGGCCWWHGGWRGGWGGWHGGGWHGGFRR